VQPGDQIARYRIERLLGRGGMGAVYLARDLRLDRPVALKFLASDVLTDPDKQRFLQEARAAAMLRHPNICTIHDIEEADGHLFLSMAYLEGETLAQRIARGPVPVEQAVAIAIQLLQGLDKAHSLGVIHRDIKSRNIIVGPDGHTSVLDFGLALIPGADRLTNTGITVGTPSYMSPEQCQGTEVDPRSDLWSAGVVLFEMLTGTLPFRREQAAAVTHAIVHDPVPDLASLRPAVPPALQAVVEKALAKDRQTRWASAREMAQALQPFALPHSTGASFAVSRGTDSTITRVTLATQRTGEAPLTPERGSALTQPALTQPALTQPEGGRARWYLIGGAGAVAALAVAMFLRTDSGGAEAPPAPPATPGSPGASNSNSPVPLVAPTRLVAVLPFTAEGGSSESVQLADGVMEMLSSDLAGFERLGKGIAAIPSAEIRRRAIATPAEAKRVYGAQLVVTGTARDSVSKLEVEFALRLVDTASGQQLQTRSFLYSPSRGQENEKLAAATLAALLGVDAAGTVISAAATNRPDASLAYLRGRGLLARFDAAGNLDLAIAQLSRAATLDPNYALAQAALAEAYWRKSRATGDAAAAKLALEHGERAVALEPLLSTVHVTLGAIYTTSGREQDAIVQLKEAQRLAPGSAEASRELARAYEALGRFPEAEAAYRAAIQARPTDWYGYLLLGLFYSERLERYEDALQAFEQARALTPDNELVYRNLGIAQMSQGNYDAATAELERALKIKSSATAYASLGAAYFLRHRYPEAMAAVETAIDLDPNRYYYWGNLGIYSKWNPGSEGRAPAAFGKAIELARKMLAVSPNDPEPRANLAEYLARTGNKQGALAEVARIPAAAIPAMRDRVAIVYELTGKRGEAIRLLAGSVRNPVTWKAIADDPDLAELWNDPALRRAVSGRK
jgi:tetratricopeptide (TPR) repeat protein/TolB-like protein